MSVQQSNEGVQSGEPGGLSVDDIHFTLSNCRRRYLIRYLSREGESTVKELSAVIAARENDTTVDELSYADRKTVYTALLQTHLPKLDEMDVVEYDTSSKRVRLAGHADQLQPYIEEGDEGTDPDDTRYTVVLWALLVVAALGLLGGRYAVSGLEGTMLTMLSLGVAVGVAVGFSLAATSTV